MISAEPDELRADRLAEDDRAPGDRESRDDERHRARDRRGRGPEESKKIGQGRAVDSDPTKSSASRPVGDGVPGGARRDGEGEQDQGTGDELAGRDLRAAHTGESPPHERARERVAEGRSEGGGDGDERGGVGVERRPADQHGHGREPGEQPDEQRADSRSPSQTMPRSAVNSGVEALRIAPNPTGSVWTEIAMSENGIAENAAPAIEERAEPRSGHGPRPTPEDRHEDRARRWRSGSRPPRPARPPVAATCRNRNAPPQTAPRNRSVARWARLTAARRGAAGACMTAGRRSGDGRRVTAGLEVVGTAKPIAAEVDDATDV